ncbi:unnamed protein product, partial [Diplocarpon coronariae]
IPNTN